MGEPRLGANFNMQLPGPAKPSEKKVLFLLSHSLQHLCYTSWADCRHQEDSLLCPLPFRSCVNHRAIARCITRTIRLSCWGVETRTKHGKESDSCRNRLPYWWRMWAHDIRSPTGCLGLTKRHCRNTEQKEAIFCAAFFHSKMLKDVSKPTGCQTKEIPGMGIGYVLVELLASKKVLELVLQGWSLGLRGDLCCFRGLLHSSS